jgi:hypothetical protein
MNITQISPNPEIKPDYKYDLSCIHKRNVVLDLDETLISGKACNDEIDFEKDKSQLMKFKFHNMDDLYLISERPGVQDFLTKLFEGYTVSVWTAASKDYALFIIENVILNTPQRHLKYIFWSDHGSISKKLYDRKPKKLSLLWDVFRLPGFDPYNTIIIDDYGRVTSSQPENAIRISEFDCTRQGHEHDNELSGMCDTLEDKFKTLKASRPKLSVENTELDKIEHRTLLHKIESSESGGDDDDDDDDDDSLISETTDSYGDADGGSRVANTYQLNTESGTDSGGSDSSSGDSSGGDSDDDDSNKFDSKPADTDADAAADITISKKVIETRKHRIENYSTDEESVQSPESVPESQLSEKFESDGNEESPPSDPIDLSSININPDLKKAAEQNLQGSIKKLKFSDSTESSQTIAVPVAVPAAVPVAVPAAVVIEKQPTTHFENDDSDDGDSDGADNEKLLESLHTKHNFDKAGSHDDDDADDDDGESKVCKKCSHDFITYSGKDHCPGCR